MHIKEITDYTVWTNHFNQFDSPSFLQSWEWGELQKKLGYITLRFGIYDDVIPEKAGIQATNSLIGIAQIIKIKARRGNMLFIPHGPIFKSTLHSTQLFKILTVLKDYLADCAKKEGYAFVRFAPIWENKPEYRQMFKDLGCKTAPIYMHSERVWILDVTKPEEQLLSEMRKTTRYSIRKAEKEGVVVKKRDDEEAIDEFVRLYKETADRENFTPFSPKYLLNEFKAFHKTGSSSWFFSYEKDGRLTAAALINYTQSTAFYHQGATLHSKIPTSYILQWESIKEAKRRGCKYYNFWGTLQIGRTPKSWGGLTLFKQGFGGFQRDYVPTQDYIVNWPRYHVNFLYEQYLKYKRGI